MRLQGPLRELLPRRVGARVRPRERRGLRERCARGARVTYIHINRPTGYYIGQTRRIGARRWSTVTGHCRSGEGALAAAVRTMRQDDKRARALFICDSGWYEPTIVMEAHR